jgi:hypothetical protein
MGEDAPLQVGGRVIEERHGELHPADTPILRREERQMVGVNHRVEHRQTRGVGRVVLDRPQRGYHHAFLRLLHCAADVPLVGVRC